MALSLNAWKGLSMVLFTGITVIGAVVAVLMKEKAQQIYVTCGVMFSAGVLLAGGFVHMLGDSSEQFEEYAPNFPWAFAVAGGTVVLLAVVEIAMERVLEDVLLPGAKKDKTEETSGDASGEERTNGKSYQEADADDDEDDEASHVHDKSPRDASHVHDVLLDDGTNPFSAILLTLVLGIHVLIEGMGLGAQVDVSEFGTAFIAIAIHKGFVAFALAENLVTSGYWQERSRRKYFYLSLGLFILMTLVGIAIGWGISGSGEESIATAILTAMMSGSFIYVAILEILPHETKIIKRERLAVIPVLFFFVAGYCLMALLAVWA